MLLIRFCIFKQKTAYNMRIIDWSSDVCSSDLRLRYVQLSSTSNCGLSIFDGDRPCSLRKDVSLCCPAASGADGSCRLAEGAMVGHRMACPRHASRRGTAVGAHTERLRSIEAGLQAQGSPGIPGGARKRSDEKNLRNG